MSLASTYGADKFGLSFELYPPKTASGESALIAHVELLMACKPNFITCTYGAGGSTRQKTLDIIAQVKQHFDVPVASHLTCVGLSVDQLREYLIQAQRIGSRLYRRIARRPAARRRLVPSSRKWPGLCQ